MNNTTIQDQFNRSLNTETLFQYILQDLPVELAWLQDVKLSGPQTPKVIINKGTLIVDDYMFEENHIQTLISLPYQLLNNQELTTACFNKVVEEMANQIKERFLDLTNGCEVGSQVKILDCAGYWLMADKTL